MSDNITYKFILLGNGNVGKTCIFKKISADEFSKNSISTIGVDYRVLNYVIEIEENGKKIKKKIKIKLFDTAGQERYRALTKSYINNSNGIIIVYDLTERKSFDDVIVWIRSIEEKYGKKIDQINACIFLIGNKNDLVVGEEGEKKREIQANEAESFAEKNGLLWGGECSAKEYTKKKFDESFRKISKIIYSKHGNKESGKDGITLDKKNANIKKESCKC